MCIIPFTEMRKCALQELGKIMLFFEERGKLVYPEKNLLEQGQTQPHTYDVDLPQVVFSWAK